jgi:hypothetical protein
MRHEHAGRPVSLQYHNVSLRVLPAGVIRYFYSISSYYGCPELQIANLLERTRRSPRGRRLRPEA